MLPRSTNFQLALKKPFVKNRVFDACAKTIIACALIHVFFMALYALVTWEFSIFNGFKILGIDLFYPKLDLGIINFILGSLLLAAIFGVVYKFFTESK
jgi:hypothetical protein